MELLREPEVLRTEAQESLRDFALANQVVQCDVIRQVSGSKSASGGVSTTSKVVASYAVKVASLFGLRRETEMMSGAGLVEAENTYQFFFPRDADVQQGDRLQVGTAVRYWFLEVMGNDRVKTSSTRLIVLAKEKR